MEETEIEIEAEMRRHREIYRDFNRGRESDRKSVRD